MVVPKWWTYTSYGVGIYGLGAIRISEIFIKISKINSYMQRGEVGTL
jgi:hypothetical protein